MNETTERIERANPVPRGAVHDDEFIDSAALFSSIVSSRDLMTRTHARERTATTPARAPWFRRPAFVTLTAAAVMVVAIGATTLTFGGGGGPSPADTALPAANEPASPVDETPALNTVDPPAITWSRIEPQGIAGPLLYLDGVIAGGPGLIAVGAPSRSEPEMIWTSTTGTDWKPADVRGSGYAYDVAAGGPGYVAVGSSVWTSTDGTTWQELPRDPIIGEARAITVGGPGLVAVGTIGDGPAAAWTSEDGLAWTRVPHTASLDGDAEMLDVITGGPGFIAVGRHGSTAAVWTSPDGINWSLVPHDTEVFGDGTVGTEILSVTAGGPGYVAVSAIGDTGMGVWTSPDGTSWSPVPLDPAIFDADEEMTVIVQTGTGLISAGFEGGDAAAWFSVDGLTWTPLDHGGAFESDGLQRISDIALVGDGLAAVGYGYVEDEGSGIVWIAKPSPAKGQER